jgi:Ran GTPase-activating protein (RanGAP) involved in mRNA processing and transport
MLTSNTTLRSLVVKRARIGNTGGTDIFRALMVNRTLTEIGLPRNHLGARAGPLEESLGTAIVRVLETNTALKSLDLDGNMFSRHVTADIVGAVSVNTTLKRLCLSTAVSLRGRAPCLGADAGMAICGALGRNRSLRTLRIAGTGLASGVPAALGTALADNDTLTALDMCRCDFNNSAEFRELCDGIARNRKLEALNFDNTALPAGAGSALAAILRVHPRLTDLSICNLSRTVPNQRVIGPAGVGHLCNALAANFYGTLTRLNLTGHVIDAGGTAHIATLLRAPRCRLRWLNLGRTDLGEAGCLALCAALEDNRSLTRCSFGHGGSNDVATALARAIRTNRTLTALDIRDAREFSFAGYRMLASALGGNNVIRRVRSVHIARRVPPTPVLAPLTAGQRFAFVSGYYRQANCAFRQLPLDMVRRIARCYAVLQGVRRRARDGLRTSVMGNDEGPDPFDQNEDRFARHLL